MTPLAGAVKYNKDIVLVHAALLGRAVEFVQGLDSLNVFGKSLPVRTPGLKLWLGFLFLPVQSWEGIGLEKGRPGGDLCKVFNYLMVGNSENRSCGTVNRQGLKGTSGQTWNQRPTETQPYRL